MHTLGKGALSIEERPLDARIVVNKDTWHEIAARIGHPPV